MNRIGKNTAYRTQQRDNQDELKPKWPVWLFHVRIVADGRGLTPLVPAGWREVENHDTFRIIRGKTELFRVFFVPLIDTSIRPQRLSG